VNEILRRALLSAHLDEEDVAARLEVDPKTVRRWLEGRLPYTRHRWALADLLNVSETDLWPDLSPSRSRPDELLAVYPHRSSITRDTWRTLFASAKHEIGILDYSSLFLAKDSDILRILAAKANSGARVRICTRRP
jgi:transcriptional regulator with XRE-family HTH domain